MASAKGRSRSAISRSNWAIMSSEEVQMGQLLGEQEAAGARRTARRAPLQLRQLVAQLAPGPVRPAPLMSVSPATSACSIVAPGDAHNVGGDTAQLDVGALQRLLQPVDLGGALADQRGAVARQLAQLALGGRG